MSKPPFNITPLILELLTHISRLIGQYEGLMAPVPEPELRRQNRIKTIHATVAIEGNTLSADQITAILDQKRVVGSKQDILEVQNTIRAYEMAATFNPYKEEDLLKAHGILMKQLIREAGKYRTTNVGIIKGLKVSHVAPKPQMVVRLMAELFQFLKDSSECPLILKACVFHYELEFIHPFVDGNGRIGRLWQHVLLLAESSAFAYIPVESLIKEHQKTYYKALAESDKAGDSTSFVEFMLLTIKDAFEQFLNQLHPQPLDTQERLNRAKIYFGKKSFARKHYLELFKTISSATASRDLQYGCEAGMLIKAGDKARTIYKLK